MSKTEPQSRRTAELQSRRERRLALSDALPLCNSAALKLWPSAPEVRHGQT